MRTPMARPIARPWRGQVHDIPAAGLWEASAVTAAACIPFQPLVWCCLLPRRPGCFPFGEPRIECRAPVEHLTAALDEGWAGLQAAPAPQGGHRAAKQRGRLLLGEQFGTLPTHTQFPRDRGLTSVITNDSVRTSELEVPRR